MKSKSSEISSKRRVEGCLLHIPVGIFTVFCGYVGWYLALIFFGAFMIYEVNEDWHLKDQAWIDIFGYLIGIALGVIGLFIWEVLTNGIT